MEFSAFAELVIQAVETAYKVELRTDADGPDIMFLGMLADIVEQLECKELWYGSDEE